MIELWFKVIQYNVVVDLVVAISHYVMLKDVREAVVKNPSF